MYLASSSGEEMPNPDPRSGLYVQTRSGRIQRVSLPAGSIGFQIGETSQIHSGGVLRATPHAVKACRKSGVTRESFAVFMEPEYHGDMDLPSSRTVQDVQDASIVLPTCVQTLADRWLPGMNFGEFGHATLAAFY